MRSFAPTSNLLIQRCPLSEHFALRILCSVVGFRRDAIRRNVNLKIPHIGVVGAEEHADVGCNSGQNQARGAEVFKQDFEIGLKKSRQRRIELSISSVLNSSDDISDAYK